MAHNVRLYVPVAVIGHLALVKDILLNSKSTVEPMFVNPHDVKQFAICRYRLLMEPASELQPLLNARSF